MDIKKVMEDQARHKEEVEKRDTARQREKQDFLKAQRKLADENSAGITVAKKWGHDGKEPKPEREPIGDHQAEPKIAKSSGQASRGNLDVRKKVRTWKSDKPRRI